MFVVRWEFWPVFLYLAKKSQSRLTCIDLSFNLSKVSQFKKSIYKFFLSKFDFIFLVEADDLPICETMDLDKSSVLKIIGDTKYDRVVERVRNNFCNDRASFKLVEDWVGGQNVIVVGSAWKDDWMVLLESFKSNSQLNDWKVIIAPHDISKDNISCLISDINHYNQSFTVLSDSRLCNDSRILIVDSIGLLASLYKLSDLSFVGGGLHHRVHNVLEPACYGKPVAFGPRYKTSKEAIKLVASKLATVVSNSDEFKAWTSTFSTSQERNILEKKLIVFINSLTGASKRAIVTVLGDVYVEKASRK